ncbi:MAG: hypothetical protein COT73_08035 [Bdellovibrio sp. CG10_big_fil_rev_8_21_14_0_10_47_8]|nr:MAG: hypothetical protein COT73_08035 [Bdellovibrio sp. CG10_big_fil_rev_8_21_14_0_10_47_8]
MDAEEAAILMQKAFGVISLVMFPIILAIVIYSGIKGFGTQEELTAREWVLGLAFSTSGIAFGVWVCRKEFGWFKRKG